jgi:predicted DNA-binding protein YlxM (UPF0122 family)
LTRYHPACYNWGNEKGNDMRITKEVLQNPELLARLLTRNEDIKKKYNEGNYTMQELGDAYGISRQRIHQIVGSGNRTIQQNRIQKRKKEREKRILSMSDKTNKELAAILDRCTGSISAIRGRTRHAVESNCSVGVGANWEEWVAQQIGSKGMNCELMPVRTSYDILVEGKIRIDVKSAKNSASLANVSPVYRFRVRKRKDRTHADFYICVISETKDLFIIPSNIVRPDLHQIAFTYPDSGYHVYQNKEPNWRQYHNRWDLLEEAIERSNQ